MTELADNILKLRHLSGMTQEDFGRVAGVSRSAVAQWERGYAEPRMGNIQKLSDFFKIPKAWIIEKDGMSGTEFVGGSIIKRSEGPALSDDELQLLYCYRSADNRGKSTIMAVATAQSGTGMLK